MVYIQALLVILFEELFLYFWVLLQKRIFLELE